MSENFSPEKVSDNPEVAEYFKSLPTSVKEIIMQDNRQFSSKQEIQAFAQNILGKQEV